ncbi:MAG: hypothetical protein CMJ65_18150 [Planctomycetaceae bacterium]|jgi:beta-RFAP synthase|nr:hypothetical protein [Planctomycetaceae bacterium]
MILEGLVTTVSPSGELNLAPMGPEVDGSMSRFVLRPFQTSTTFSNLVERSEGVFHVTDDVLLLAHAATGTVVPPPETFAAEVVQGRVVAGACRWYEFRIEEIDTSSERAELTARVVHSGRLRDFAGLHRARHAVVEAAILATRVHLLPPDDLRRQFADLAVIVDKTAGPREREAFELLESHVVEAMDHPLTVKVSTGARLHLGLLSHGGNSPRQFGGAGMMIEDPGVRLTASPADHDQVVMVSEGDRIEDSNRASRWLERIGAHGDCRLPGVRIEISDVISPHAGLGSGTQLALAVARAVAGLSGAGFRAVELAAAVGRGERSGVGIHGFEHGGFLVDAGGRTGQVAALVARADVPAAWRIVLAGPATGKGLTGEAEREAFARCREMPCEATRALSSLLLQQVLPGLNEGDIDEAGEGLFLFGRLVGESFAAVQGGCYADPQMASLVEWVRGKGIRGVGQSSWGPTIWMLCPDRATADSLAADVAGRPGVGWCRVVRPLNRGADVRAVIDQPRRTLSKSG